MGILEDFGKRDAQGQYDPEQFYYVSGDHANKITELMSRLYSQTRMDAEEMRDWGNILNAIMMETKGYGTAEEMMNRGDS